MAKEPDKLNAVELLAKLDLDEIDARINDLTRELEALHALRKAVDIRQNGKPERKAPVAKKPLAKATASGDAPDGRTNLGKIYRYLQSSGPKKAPVIAADTGLDVEVVRDCLRASTFFTMNNIDGCWRIKENAAA